MKKMKITNKKQAFKAEKKMSERFNLLNSRLRDKVRSMLVVELV